MVKLDQIIHNIDLGEGVNASIDGTVVSLTKDGKTLTRDFSHPKVTVQSADGGLRVHCDLPRRKEKALAGTWAAHLRNMNKGLVEGFEYRLKAVYSHFPMTLKVDGDKRSINNLFGEKNPREAPLPWTPADVKVKVENKVEVVVSGADKEKVGQTCANIERACRIRKRDRRVFQDGIYIVSKA